MALPACTDDAQSRLQANKVNHWAQTFLNAARQSVADKAHTHMIEHGFFWSEAPKENARHHIKTLSARNYAALETRLGDLSPLEEKFRAKFMATPLIAVHCTHATPESPQQNLCLYSRKRLEASATISFNKENSPIEDREEQGNDDFVFFSLEAGLTPQKPRSALGRTAYSVDFEHPRFQQFAWLSLVEMRFPITPWLDRHVPNLALSDYETLSPRTLPDPTQVIFSGPHMKAGIVLSIVEQARLVSQRSQEILLACPDHASTNALMNGLYRPEVKVPRYFISETFQKSQLPGAPSSVASTNLELSSGLPPPNVAI